MDNCAYNPQNPYRSFFVEASAGSGKTYQLSRRFLSLVAAGAAPNKILTITFTVKAAQEMRHRIIEDATQLIYNQEASHQFDQSMQNFFRAENSVGFRLQKPLSAVQTGEKILAHTQSLKITTIDSIFHEWVMRFSYDIEKPRIDLPFAIANEEDMEQLEQDSFEKLVHKLQKSNTQFLREISDISEGGIRTISNHVNELKRYKSFIWLIERHRGECFSKLSYPKAINPNWDEKRVLAHLESEFKILFAQTAKEYEYNQALNSKALAALVESKFLTKNWTVSKQIIKGQKRERFYDCIAYIEEALREFSFYKKISFLNAVGGAYYQLFKSLEHVESTLKKQRSLVHFNDLAEACHQIFVDENIASIRYLVHKNISHLLIDEFQDTSQLQWSIFESLIDEMFSGQESRHDLGIQATAFIVGDPKQSIYGFREADPLVMQLAKEKFKRHQHHIVELSYSYRSCQNILDLVNHTFCEILGQSDFPMHKIAIAKEKKVIPNYSEIIVKPPFEVDANDEGASGLELEAEYVADFIKKILANPQQYPIWDKNSQGLRGVTSGDICILYRNTTHALDFEKELQSRGIKTKKEEKKGFFQAEEVILSLSVLRFFVFPGDRIALLEVLRSPLFQISSQQLQIALQVLRQKNTEFENKEIIDYLEQTFGVNFEPLRSAKEQFASHSGALSFILALQTIGVFNCFHFEKETESMQAHTNFSQLVELLYEIFDAGKASKSDAVHQLIKFANRDEKELAAIDQDAVTLMTIHKSKGLEFACVFLVESSQSWYRTDRLWMKDSIGNKLHYIGKKDQQPHGHAPFDRLQNIQEKSLIEESERLFYVSITRSSQYLFLSGHSSKLKKANHFYSQLQKSRFSNLVSDELQEYRRIPHSEEKSVGFKREELKVSLDIAPTQVAELSLITPHREVENKSKEATSEFSKYSSAYALAKGTLVHLIFESLVLGKHIDLLGKAKSLLIEQYLVDESPEKLYELSLAEAKNAFSGLKKDPCFISQNRIEVEMPLVLRTHHGLMRGFADLVVFSGQQIKVYDLKTTYLNKEAIEHLFAFTSKMNYHRQVGWYKQALQEIYAKQEVLSAVIYSQNGEVVNL